MLLIGSVTGASAENDTVEAEETIMYHCNASALSGLVNVNFDMPATVRSTVPTSVAPNESFYMNDSSVTVSIPAATVSTIRGILRWDSIEGSVSTFNVHSQNQDKTINAADPAIAIPVTPVPQTGDFEFTVPDVGGIDVGPFTAGNSGDVTFSGGKITATFEKGGGSTIKLDADCDPIGDPTLIQIPIN